MHFIRVSLALATTALVSPCMSAATLDDLVAYRHGIDALSGELWTVASARFEEALKTPDLDPASRRTLILRLAESLIRDHKAEAAMKILSDPVLEAGPEKSFWMGQALVAAGKLNDALVEFEKVGESDPNFQESQITQSLIRRALGDLDGAIDRLDRLIRQRNAPIGARILKAETLLENGQMEDALAALPQTAKLPASMAKRIELIRGKALLEINDADEAAAVFSALAQEDAKEGQTLRDFHQAKILLARARLAQGATQSAADGLLAFIQEKPDSPVLNEAFPVLLQCLPAQPTPNDPILTRLREWAPDAMNELPSFIQDSDDSASPWPTNTEVTSETRAPLALYYLALATRRLSAPDAALQARRLLVRLRREFPHHPLVARSLLELGRWDLDAGKKAQAAAHFAMLQKLGSSSPSELQAEALALEASSRFADGDYESAGKLFDQASLLLENERRLAAQQNAAVSLLAAGDLDDFDRVRKKVVDDNLSTLLSLERGIYLATQRNPEALVALQSFIDQHPDHPRVSEARLHAALAAVNALPPAPAVAEALLEEIPPEDQPKLSTTTLALVQIRYLQQQKKWTEAAAISGKYLSENSADPARPILLYERGRALFQNKDFNEAGIVLKTMAEEFPDHPDSQAALLLAARAAAEGATPQSRKESIELFQKLAAKETPFRDFARLELSSLHIQLSQLDEAIALLDPWFSKLEKADPLLVDVGLKLGDALFARAQKNTTYLERAMEVYNRLLSLIPSDAPARHSILYHKGLTLERFGDREDEALAAYMEVIQSASEIPEGDWSAIEDCGSGALRILEKREEWSAAKKLAKKIALLNGPNSRAFEDRAKDIGQKHMIWEE